MNEPQFPILSPKEPSRRDGTARKTRRLAGLVLGTTMLGVMGSSTWVDAAPPGTSTSPVLDADDARHVDPVRSLEVLSIDCAAPAPVAGHRVHIGCSWTLPTEAPVRQLTLWRSVDGGVRERVAAFGWPFENSYRDVVPAGTQRVAYAIIGTNGHGRIVARSRADVVRLPTLRRAGAVSTQRGDQG